ncbi:MAG TPA: polymorphic toxin type 44 domain-containing protein, partial [Anaerolineales bacterium]|nr:polymorphic toxin type 44 domain-containing protein [Anaerolineales bacterium]
KYYGARFYDSAVGRFVQADSLVPSGTQGWDRYAYANNSPILYNDPSGHVGCKAGQRCPLPPPQDARDLTQWTVAAAVDIAESVEMSIIAQQNSDGGPGGKIAAWLFFASMVGDGQKYDVKDKIELKLGQTIKLDDQWYEFSTPGNILYGFYGLAAGFTKQELHAGAGVAQWLDHINEGAKIGDWSTLLDTSDDYYAIEFGFFLYEEYYANDGELTESEFLEALSLFEDADKLALTAPPVDPYIPAEEEYETDYFYQ